MAKLVTSPKTGTLLVKVKRGKHFKWCRVLEAAPVPERPHDWWMQNTISASARPYSLADYDRDAVAIMQTMRGNKVSATGIRGLIERMVPHLNPERKHILLENIMKIQAAKKSKLDREEAAYLASLEHHAKLRTRKQKRKARASKSALAQLKALLRSR